MKKKGIFAIALLVLLIAGGVLGFGYYSAQAARLVFHANGYFLVADNEGIEDKQIKFQEGARYKEVPEQKISFKDIQGHQTVVGADSFAHFENGGISAMSKGVVTKLEELSDAPVSNFYSIQPRAVMNQSEGVYSIENSELELEFKDFIWKTSENKYILVSDSMDIHFSEEDVRTVDGFVEFEYIDEGLIRLQTSDNVWLTVSDSCYAAMQDGKIVNFSDKSVLAGGEEVFTLNKMVIDADDNIEVLQREQEMRNLKVPKFDITAEDGKDGAPGLQGDAGVEGLAGEIGEDGAEGDQGEEGDSGEEGSSGRRGERGETGDTGNSGSAGSTGGTGSTGDQEKTAYPSFTIQNWQVSGTSVACDIVAVDDDDMLADMPPAKIIIVNNHTGEKVYEVTGGHDFGSSLVYRLDTENTLAPDTQYRLIVNATYSPDPEAASLVRDFISKTFYTDSTGVFLEYGHAKEDALYVTLKKNEYSTAEEAKVYLFASRQAAEAFDPDSADQTWEGVVTQNISIAGEVSKDISFDNLGLISNKEYVARLLVKNGTGSYVLSDAMLYMKTLKKPATVGEPIVVKNKAAYSFDMQPLNVSDPDNGITNFRYNIYYADEYQQKGDSAQLVAFVDSKTAKSVSLAIDGSRIEQGKAYVAVLAATFHDNETEVEIKTKASNEFMMDGTSMPTVMFVLDKGSTGAAATTTSSKHDLIEGNLVINKTSPIQVADDKQLVVNVEAPGDYYKQFLYGKDTSAYSESSDRIEIPMILNGLRAATQYKFTVYGYVDFNDGRGYNYVNIGSVVVSTNKTKSTKAEWTNGDPDAALSMALSLTDDNASEAADYEMGTAAIMELKLYEGSNKAKLVGSVTLTDRDAGNWTSTLKDEFYKAAPARIITEKDFNLNSAQLTASTYALELSAIYDYTYNKTEENLSGYKNQIPVVNDTIVISKTNAPPPLPAPGAGVAAMPITNDNASAYGGVKDPAMPDKAVVGYLLTANYDNGAKLGRTMTFYAFENAAYDTFKAGDYAEDIYSQSPIYNATSKKDPVTAGTALFKTPELAFNNNAAATAPQVAFLFGNPPASSPSSGEKGGVHYYYTGSYDNTRKKGISRGMQLKFAYTAQLSRSGTATIDTYYPHSLSSYIEYRQHVPRSATIDLPKQNPTVMAYPWAGSSKYDVWKYLIIDHDNAIPRDTANGTKTAWLMGEKPGQAGSKYMLASSSDKVPGLPNTTIADFISANYMEGNTQTNVTIDYTPQGTELSAIDSSSFKEVILPVDKKTDLVTQMGAPVSWYNEELYPGGNNIDVQASSKNDGAGAIKTTVPIFRNRYAYSEYPTSAKLNGVNVTLDANDTTLGLNVVRIHITGIPAELYSQLAGMRVSLRTGTGASEKEKVVFKSLENFMATNGLASGSITIRTSEFADLVGGTIEIQPQFLLKTGMKGYYYTSSPSYTYALAKYNADGSESNFLSSDVNDSKLIELDSRGERPLDGSAFYSRNQAVLGQQAKFTAVNRLGSGNSYSQVSLNQANLNYSGVASSDKSFTTPVYLSPLSKSEFIKTFTLNSVTPSIKLNTATDVTVGLNDITFDNIVLEGTSPNNIRHGEVYFTVYDLNKKEFVEGTETIAGHKHYWPMAVTEKTIQFTGLSVGNSYQIIPWCVATDGTLRHLLDATSAALPQAIYQISTSDKVNISNLQVKYMASSYSTKTVVFNFGLDQLLNLVCQYEVWEVDQAGNVTGDKPILEHKDALPVYAPSGNTHTFTVGPADTVRLQPGRQYKAKVVAYSKSGAADVIGERAFDFWTPAYTTPLFYVTPVPTKSGENYGLNISVTVSDPNYSLTSTDPSRGGEYMVVVYERGANKSRRVVFSGAAFTSGLIDSALPRSISVSGLKGNTSYEIVLYGITDITGNGLTAEGVPLPTLADLTEEEINKDKPYIVKQSVLTSTLDEYGVKFGDVGIAADGNKVKLQFTGAVGIENVIDKISYSMTFTKNGKTETITDTFDPRPITAIDPEEGLYEIALPRVMTEKGKHNVTIQLKGTDDRLLKSISGTCYYR